MVLGGGGGLGEVKGREEAEGEEKRESNMHR